MTQPNQSKKLNGRKMFTVYLAYMQDTYMQDKNIKTVGFRVFYSKKESVDWLNSMAHRKNVKFILKETTYVEYTKSI